MKRVVNVLMVIICIFSISACSFNENKISDSQKFKEEYENYNGKIGSSGKEYLKLDIEEDNIIKYTSINEIIEILESGTGVIYLGFPECPWCRNIVPVLLNAGNNTDLDKIYYLNMSDVRDKMELDENNNIITTEEASEGYHELLAKLDSILSDYILKDSDGNEYNTGEKRIYVPTVLFIRKGQIVDYHFDTVDSQTDPYVALDEEQELELYNIYLAGIHKVLNDQCEDSEEGEEHC